MDCHQFHTINSSYDDECRISKNPSVYTTIEDNEREKIFPFGEDNLFVRR